MGGPNPFDSVSLASRFNPALGAYGAALRDTPGLQRDIRVVGGEERLTMPVGAVHARNSVLSIGRAIEEEA